MPAFLLHHGDGDGAAQLQKTQENIVGTDVIGDCSNKMASMSGILLDYCLTVPTSSIHRIQESHVALYHIMWDMVHTFLQSRSLDQEESHVSSPKSQDSPSSEAEDGHR